MTNGEKLNSAAEEAANRAEVTAILIRMGFGVYRPEFDWNGEDLIIKTADNRKFKVVQLKSRAYVDEARYRGKNIWMLFPDGPFASTGDRTWYLLPHDELFDFTERQYGHGAGWKQTRRWSYPSITSDLLSFLTERAQKIRL